MTPGSEQTRGQTGEHSMWLAHDDANCVEFLYAAWTDTPKQQARELAKVIRRGLTVRRITDEDGARQAWGKVLSEAALRKIAASPEYDPEDGSAVQIANALVGVES